MTFAGLSVVTMMLLVSSNATAAEQILVKVSHPASGRMVAGSPVLVEASIRDSTGRDVPEVEAQQRAILLGDCLVKIHTTQHQAPGSPSKVVATLRATPQLTRVTRTRASAVFVLGEKDDALRPGRYTLSITCSDRGSRHNGTPLIVEEPSSKPSLEEVAAANPHLGEYWHIQKRCDRALQHLNAALESQPDHLVALVLAADCEKQRSDFKAQHRYLVRASASARKAGVPPGSIELTLGRLEAEYPELRTRHPR